MGLAISRTLEVSPHHAGPLGDVIEQEDWVDKQENLSDLEVQGEDAGPNQEKEEKLENEPKIAPGKRGRRLKGKKDHFRASSKHNSC